MKPQDRNVNSVCLSSREPVALSRFWCVLRLIGGYFMSANVNASAAVNVATLWHRAHFPSRQRAALAIFVGFQLIALYILVFFKIIFCFPSNEIIKATVRHNTQQKRLQMVQNDCIYMLFVWSILYNRHSLVYYANTKADFPSTSTIHCSNECCNKLSETPDMCGYLGKYGGVMSRQTRR